MTAQVTIHRLPTGVPGLDDILGGGLPEFSFNLIAGQPGCGKTMLAHQLMFAMATPERSAIYCESLSNMVTALASTGVTVLMTSELEDRYTDLRFSPYGTAFMTDAIIVQRYIEIESRLLRVMAVVKVRASAHSDQLREFGIDADGIHMGTMLSGQEGLLGGQPMKKRSLEPPARST